MPSRASTSLLHMALDRPIQNCSVSMPSRASTSLLLGKPRGNRMGKRRVSMPSRASTSLLRYSDSKLAKQIEKVSMPSRASTSLLQYPFKNLGFMRFPEPVFAGICQNILTVAHFHAC